MFRVCSFPCRSWEEKRRKERRKKRFTCRVFNCCGGEYGARKLLNETIESRLWKFFLLLSQSSWRFNYFLFVNKKNTVKRKKRISTRVSNRRAEHQGSEKRHNKRIKAKTQPVSLDSDFSFCVIVSLDSLKKNVWTEIMKSEYKKKNFIHVRVVAPLFSIYEVKKKSLRR